MHKFLLVKLHEKQIYKASLVAASIALSISGKVFSAEMSFRADEVIKDPTDCTLLNQATKNDHNLYLFYECHKQAQKSRKYFLLRRHLTGNDFDDLVFPWHVYQANTFVFGSCKLHGSARTNVNAIVPGEGKNSVPIKEVVAAWKINSSTEKMEEVSKKQLSVCYEPGFEQ